MERSEQEDFADIFALSKGEPLLYPHPGNMGFDALYGTRRRQASQTGFADKMEGDHQWEDDANLRVRA